jgi:hypothetical protein
MNHLVTTIREKNKEQVIILNTECKEFIILKTESNYRGIGRRWA